MPPFDLMNTTITTVLEGTPDVRNILALRRQGLVVERDACLRPAGVLRHGVRCTMTDTTQEIVNAPGCVGDGCWKKRTTTYRVPCPELSGIVRTLVCEERRSGPWLDRWAEVWQWADNAPCFSPCPKCNAPYLPENGDVQCPSCVVNAYIEGVIL